MQLRDEVLSLRKSVEDEQQKRAALQLFVQRNLTFPVGGVAAGGAVTGTVAVSPSPVLLTTTTTTPEH
jgi:hypothetical protein